MRILISMTLVSLFLLMSACAQQPPGVQQAPVLLTIISRHQTITIRHSSLGPVYTVQTTDGRVVVREQTLETIQAQDPDTYRLIKDALAADSRLDSRIDIAPIR